MGISTLNLHVVQVLVAQSCPAFATPWTVAHQAPLSMEFSRQEYWNGLSFPFPGDLPDPGIKYRSPTLQADSLPSEPPIFKVHLIPYTLMIYLHIDIKAAFIIHAIINRTKKIHQAPTGCRDLSLKWWHGVNLS